MKSRGFSEGPANPTDDNIAALGPLTAPTEAGEAADKRQMSVIGADIIITGNIEASVDLQIEGRVVGDVRCATLILGESSSIKGRIFATRVKVSGSVDGAVDARDLAIEATGSVSGEISYQRLRISNGGAIEGTLTRKPGDESAEEIRLKLVESPPSEKASGE